jgi:hypothetical protein
LNAEGKVKVGYSLLKIFVSCFGYVLIVTMMEQTKIWKVYTDKQSKRMKLKIHKITKYFVSILLSALSLSSFSQDYDSERTTLANFLKRMYNQTQFEGVKIVEDYDNQYFISVLTLEKAKYKTNSAMMRVAQVKAMRQASEFVNGGQITSDLVIRTVESKDSTGVVSVSEETIDRIHSVGFVQGMELLVNFPSPKAEGTEVFIFIRQIKGEEEK